MEMGSIFVLYIKPTIPTYVRWVASDYSAVMCGLLAGYKEQRLIPFPSFIPTLVSLLFQAMFFFFSFHRNVFPLHVPGLFLSLWFYVCTDARVHFLCVCRDRSFLRCIVL